MQQPKKHFNLSETELKLTIFVSMIMAVSICFSIIAFPKILNFYGFRTTAGVIFFPLTYTASDLIGFLLGKKAAIFAFKIAVFLDIAFSLSGVALYYLHSDLSFKHNNVYHYLFVRHGIILSLSAAIGVYISQKLNIALFFMRRISKLAFPLRSSFSSIPSDFLVAIFAIVPTLWFDNSVNANFIFALNSALAKCVFSVFYSFIVYCVIRATVLNKNAKLASPSTLA